MGAVALVALKRFRVQRMPFSTRPPAFYRCFGTPWPTELPSLFLPARPLPLPLQGAAPRWQLVRVVGRVLHVRRLVWVRGAGGCGGERIQLG